MSSADDILRAREERAARAAALARTDGAVTVKANIPGPDKRLGEGFLLVNMFAALVCRDTGGDAVADDGADGFAALMPALGGFSKARAVALEEGEEGGRFIDIDYFPPGGASSVSRGSPRTCYLCGRPAAVCARERSHDPRELLSAFVNGARRCITSRLAAAVSDAIDAELELEDKFGLVSPVSRGSHADMDYRTMLRARDAVAPRIAQMFWTGFDGGSFTQLRALGREAESAMYAADGGVNAYKGLIFVAGLLVAAAGRVLAARGRADDMYGAAADICAGVCDELGAPGGEDTFGKRAFRLYGVRGARGQAADGFPAVRRAEKLIGGDLSPRSLRAALCDIAGNAEDTVLLKRSGSYDRYLYFRQRISSVDPCDETELGKINAECVANGISVGGSADLLVAAVLAGKLRAMWKFF